MATSKKKVVKKSAKPASGSPSGTAAANFMKELSDKAEKLHKARRRIDQLKEKHRLETDDLFREISDLKAEVLNGLKIVGLSQVKVKGGASYYISKSRGVQIKNEIALQKWATENRLVRPDMELVKQSLKKLADKDQIPSFAEIVESETISYRSNKPTDKKAE